MDKTLPPSYTLRQPEMDDLVAVTNLLSACSLAEYGTQDFTIEDIRGLWQQPGFSLTTDAWLVISPDGQIIGYGVLLFDYGQLVSYVRVHPLHCGQGIATFLLRQTEERAGEMARHLTLECQTIRTVISGINLAAHQLLEGQEYKMVRHFWRMEITLGQPPAAPLWPTGISVYTLAPDQDIHPIYQAVEEAFQDHWGYHPTPFEEWEYYWRQRKYFDPSLWFIALDGAAVAGVALCCYRTGVAWVSQLAVRRPWRHRGLGLALLHQAFSEFYQRGERTIGLTVDAENLTGATRLYEKAGMRAVRQLDHYEKALHPGKRSST